MDGTAEVPIGGGLLPLERPHQRGGVLGIVLAGAVHCKLGHLMGGWAQRGSELGVRVLTMEGNTGGSNDTGFK